jgi:hypothetical protein
MRAPPDAGQAAWRRTLAFTRFRHLRRMGESGRGPTVFVVGNAFSENHEPCYDFMFSETTHVPRPRAMRLRRNFAPAGIVEEEGVSRERLVDPSTQRNRAFCDGAESPISPR